MLDHPLHWDAVRLQLLRLDQHCLQHNMTGLMGPNINPDNPLGRRCQTLTAACISGNMIIGMPNSSVSTGGGQDGVSYLVPWSILPCAA